MNLSLLLPFLLHGRIVGQNPIQKNGNHRSDAISRREENGHSIPEPLQGGVAIGTLPKGGGVRRASHILKGERPDRDAHSHGEGHGRDESDAATLQIEVGEETDSGNQYVGEEEDGHSAEDAVGNGGDDAGDFGEDSHENEPEGRGESGAAGGALGERDDSVVLREGGVGHGGAEGGEHGAKGVGRETSLNAAGVLLRFDVEFGYLVGGRDVSDGFDGGDGVGDEEGDDGGAVEADAEPFGPEEVHDGCRFDFGGVHVGQVVVGGDAGDHVAEEEGQDDVAVFHEGGSAARKNRETKRSAMGNN